MTKYWVIPWLIMIFSVVACVLGIIYGTNITGIAWNIVAVLFAMKAVLDIKERR